MIVGDPFKDIDVYQRVKLRYLHDVLCSIRNSLKETDFYFSDLYERIPSSAICDASSCVEFACQSLDECIDQLFCFVDFKNWHIQHYGSETNYSFFFKEVDEQ